MGASVTLWEATAPVKLPASHCCPSGSRTGVERRPGQSGISPAPPRGLASTVLRLPPILHSPSLRPMASWSKAPRGLFVLPRVDGIFTVTSISPGPSLRQRPDRYAFRAGRNLPDKEFRYLRTVIVTAAVYRGFGWELALRPLTFRHWAGISPYTSACAFAETCVFGKQSPGPLHCDPLPRRRAWRRYGTRGTPSPEVTASCCRVP